MARAGQSLLSHSAELIPTTIDMKVLALSEERHADEAP
jgi:hypothetical protein